jgi:hypothetical protein
MRKMARDGMCVSTVLVGPGRHSEFLVQLADWGNGRYYNASDRFNLPEIMLKQPSTARLPAYRPGRYELTPRGGPGWWGGTDPSTTPEIAGYVETRSRSGADVLLETRQDAHPVLASWRFGLGRVTAFMTEPTGEGTEPWKDWGGYGPFLARVLSRTASEARMPFEFSLTRRDHALVLRAERRERSDVRPTASLIDEGGVEGDRLSFRERADGIFTARFLVDPEREVRILAGIDDAARGARFRLVSDSHADVAPELLVDPVDALDLSLAAQATGGVSTSVAGIGRFAPEVGGGTRPMAVLGLWPFCLLAALLLYIGEIAYRRSPFRVLAD